MVRGGHPRGGRGLLLVEDVFAEDLLVVPSPLVDLMLPRVALGVQLVEWSRPVDSL